METLIAILVILLLAFVPMAVYAAILWWFDRYEKEPLGLLIAAFLWGAIPAVIFSLIAQIIADVPLTLLMGPSGTLVSAPIIAPITEEPFKGLALLLLLLFFRREIDGPMDGILYGGLVGFGFAAVENVFYFIGAYDAEGLQGVLVLSALRAVLFGLNHALFTAFTGLGIALARTHRNWAVKIGAPIAGLGAAIILHAIHNTGATLGAILCWPILFSIVADWGGVLSLLGIIIWATVREQKWIKHYLTDEVEAGAISAQDYYIIQSYWRRVGERLKLLLRGDFARWWRLGRYYHLATEMAFTKHRWITHGKEQETGMRLEKQRRDLYELRKQL